MTLQIFLRSDQAGSLSHASTLQALQFLVQNAAGERPPLARSGRPESKTRGEPNLVSA